MQLYLVHHRVGVIIKGPEPSPPQRFPSDVKRFRPSIIILFSTSKFGIHISIYLTNKFNINTCYYIIPSFCHTVLYMSYCMITLFPGIKFSLPFYIHVF